MRRIMKSVAALTMCLFILFSPLTYAMAWPEDTFRFRNEGFTVYIDETYWYVTTQYDYYDDPVYKELNISPEYEIRSLRDDNILLYAYSHPNDEIGMCLSIRCGDIEGYEGRDFSRLRNSDILELAKKLNKSGLIDSRECAVYKTKYKFAEMYYDSNGGDNPYYFNTYYTVVNGSEYLFRFLSSDQFTAWDFRQMESIMESVEFDVDYFAPGSPLVIAIIILAFVVSVVLCMFPFIRDKVVLYQMGGRLFGGHEDESKEINKIRIIEFVKRIIAGVLIGYQLAGIFAAIIKDQMDFLFGRGIPVIIGVLLPAIIAFFLLKSARKDRLKREVLESLDEELEDETDEEDDVELEEDEEESETSEEEVISCDDSDCSEAEALEDGPRISIEEVQAKMDELSKLMEKLKNQSSTDA